MQLYKLQYKVILDLWFFLWFNVAQFNIDSEFWKIRQPDRLRRWNMIVVTFYFNHFDLLFLMIPNYQIGKSFVKALKIIDQKVANKSNLISNQTSGNFLQINNVNYCIQIIIMQYIR